MRGSNSETAPGAGFVGANFRDLQNALNGLEQGVKASASESAIR